MLVSWLDLILSFLETVAWIQNVTKNFWTIQFQISLGCLCFFFLVVNVLDVLGVQSFTSHVSFHCCEEG